MLVWECAGGLQKEKIEEDTRLPKYFSTDEAVEYGIIDKVIIPFIFLGVCICELFCWRNYLSRHKLNFYYILHVCMVVKYCPGEISKAYTSLKPCLALEFFLRSNLVFWPYGWLKMHVEIVSVICIFTDGEYLDQVLYSEKGEQKSIAADLKNVKLM